MGFYLLSILELSSGSSNRVSGVNWLLLVAYLLLVFLWAETNFEASHDVMSWW
jgi:hypothetical protein